jgi:hypothetical protein
VVHPDRAAVGIAMLLAFTVGLEGGQSGFEYFQHEAGYTRTGSHNKRVNGRETGQWHEADLAAACPDRTRAIPCTVQAVSR